MQVNGPIRQKEWYQEQRKTERKGGRRGGGRGGGRGTQSTTPEFARREVNLFHAARHKKTSTTQMNK